MERLYVNCTVIGENRLECQNGTIYKVEEQPLPENDMDFWIYLSIYAGLVIFAGLMGGLSTAYGTLDITTVRTLKEGGTKKERKYARWILSLLKQDHLLSVTFLFLSSGAAQSMPIFLNKLVHPAFAIAISVVSLVVFANMLPNGLCGTYNFTIAGIFAPLSWLLIGLTCVVTWPVAKILDCLFGGNKGTYFKRSQLKVLVDIHAKDDDVENPLSEQEIKIIKNALDMQVKQTKDVMVPIEHVFMMNIDEVLNKDTLRLIQQVSFSRIPIYEGNRNNVVSVLLTKALITQDPEKAVPVRSLIFTDAMRDVIYVSPDQHLFETLCLLTGPKGHLAFVRDNELSTSTKQKIIGILTLEDLIEDLIEEDIVDETGDLLNINSKLQIANTKRASVSVFMENYIRNKRGRLLPKKKRDRYCRSSSVPQMDLSPFYSNTNFNKSSSSIHSTSAIIDENTPLIKSVNDC